MSHGKTIRTGRHPGNKPAVFDILEIPLNEEPSALPGGVIDHPHPVEPARPVRKGRVNPLGVVRSSQHEGTLYVLETVKLVEEVAQGRTAPEKGIEVFKTQDARRQLPRLPEDLVNLVIVTAGWQTEEYELPVRVV